MPALASAFVAGRWATGLDRVTHDVTELDSTGRWVVVLPYDGPAVCARFSTWTNERPDDLGSWRGPAPEAWSTSLDAAAYQSRVERIRELVAEGSVYQANLCRIMSAPLPDAAAGDIAGLWELLRIGNPSPYGGYVALPSHDVALASASPELFLRLSRRGSDRVVTSGPIKGTGHTADDLSAKDVAENVMIVDLVRNDLSRVSRTGSVTVPHLLSVEEHPGLVHLVSYVEGILDVDVTWPSLVEATFPPGSVTGAPKIAALSIIDELETASREFYCGAFGWVDADTGEAELAVSIRSFWARDGVLRFGTGAGITWGSEPAAEWRETELKAARLIAVASGAWQAGAP